MDNGVRFVAYGDNLIHDAIYEYADRTQNGNYDFLYEDVLEDIAEADLAAVQLESILVDDPDAVSTYPYFGTPSAVGEAIAKAGFDIVACAGNHAADKGITGIDTTTDLFAEKGVIYLGIQNSADTEYRPCEYISKNGIRFALFDYTYGTTLSIWEKYPNAVHYLDEEQIRKDIASSDADFKVVFVHWGTEYVTEPDNEQLKYAELFAELGVDVVIGTHPHVVQGTETITGADGHETWVAYSLGNFRAQQAFDERAMIGGKLTFTVEHCWDGVRIREWSLDEFKIPEYR
jgi:poly-gamma-glutamate capsule biosynthesis protein CapA/YwtB (metallophosphatase superfamily)